MSKLKINLTKDKGTGRNKPWIVRWYGEFNPITGKQRRYCKTFTKRKIAERFIEQKEQEFEAGMPRDEKNIKLKDFCDKFIRTKKKAYSKGTLDNYIGTISRLKGHFGENILIKKINQENAEEFIAQVDYIHPHFINKGKEISDSAVSIHLRNCKKLFQVALKWNYIRANPFSGISQIKPRTRPWHYFSPEEFSGIITKIPDIRKRALYSVQYGCGLRAGEAANLLWDGKNIDFETNRITVINRPGTEYTPPFKLKDYEERSIPMPKWIIDILTQLQSESKENCPFVFLSDKRWETVECKWHSFRKAGRGHEWENRMLLNNLLRDLKVYCRNAGVKTDERLTQHCLRKSWACNLADNSVPAHTLMKLGGWSSIETCQQFYLRSSDANEEKAVEVLDQLMVW